MRRLLPLLVMSFCFVPFAQAQALPQSPGAAIPRYSFAVGYNNIRANAPPSNCGCFDMNGGFVSGSYTLTRWFGAGAEFTGGHANNIGPLGQDLTLTTFTAGPEIFYRHNRFTPHAELMLGIAHGSDSYFPQKDTFSTSATSFAISTGGGLDYRLNRRFTVRPIELQYLHTGFPNGGSNQQSQLMWRAGVVLTFQHH